MKTQLILFFFATCLSSGFSQNYNQLPPVDLLSSPKTNPPSQTTESLNLVYNCETVFWTITDTGQIQQWDLINGQVTGGDVISSNSGCNSLAFCSEPASPNDLTFYASPLTNSLKKFDGTNWTTTTTNLTYINNGGYYAKQYFTGNNTKTFYYYNGTTFTQLANFDAFTNICVADIAVDSLGRAWMFTGTNQGMAYNLRIYNSTGLVANYPFSYDFANNYGTFFINDHLYVSKGDTLIPISLNGSIVVVGTPIPFPNVSYRDMASCNKVQTLGIQDPELENLITVYPNPTENTITINTTETVSSVHMYSVDGKLIKTVTNSKEINLAELAASTYFIKIITPHNVYNKSIIKK